MPDVLPIDAFLPEIMERLEQQTSLILQAEPGAGKTTRVPCALLGARFRAPNQEIWVLEPRRLAAKFAATRVAQERREELGGMVGYQFRFENVSSPHTRLRFLTEGMLMRRLIHNPRLDQVAAVILDEFHERHLHSDIALAYLRWLQTKRPELRLIVMSATLDIMGLSRYFGEAPAIQVPGRQYPVTVQYQPSAESKPLEQKVRDAVLGVFRSGNRSGDILVFLPGMAEIRRAGDALEPHRRALDFTVLPLHGDLSREEQDRAVSPSQKPKVILSTNVAETSLTIAGVTVVIDSGLHRLASYSWWSGVPALKTRPISRASAIQRAGRAGRMAPGIAIRLYPETDFNGRAPFETPEISRADLSQTLLELLSLGVNQPETLSWFEPPPPGSLAAARQLLYRLGAITFSESKMELTPRGRRMAELPTHPRLARMLLEAEQHGTLEIAATLAARITEGRLESLDALEGLSGAGDPILRRSRDHLLSALRRQSGEQRESKQSRPVTSSISRPLAFSVLMGFPDRVAQKRKVPSSASRGKVGIGELIFSSGGSALVEEAGVLLEGDTFVTLDLQEQKHLGKQRTELKVRSVCLIQPEWLFDVEPPGIKEETELSWDADRGRIVARTRMMYDGLILDESRGEPTDRAAAARLLLKAGLGIEPERLSQLSPTDLIEALRKLVAPDVMENILARILLLGDNHSSFGLPPISWEILREKLPDIFQAELSLANVLRSPMGVDGFFLGLALGGILGFVLVFFWALGGLRSSLFFLHLVLLKFLFLSSCWAV